MVFNVTARDFSVKELTRYSIKFSANSRTQENQSTLMHWDNNEIIIPFNIDRLFPYHMTSGVLTVTACFTDSHDNEINIYEVYTVDRTIPTISIETNFPYSNGTMFVSNLQQFNITCTSSKPVDIESDPWEFKLFKDNALVHTYLSPDGQYFSPYNLQPGFYRLHVNVVDFYGLKNSSYYSIWIDSQGPEFTSVNAPSSHGPIPRISISVHELILKDLYYMTNLTGSDIFEVPSFSESELEGTGDVDHHFSFLLNETIWNMMEHSDTVNIIIVAEDLFKNTTENVIIRRDDVAPTITNIYLNGTKRPLTLPTFYISNYGATSWRIKFECNKEVDQTASYLKFINGIELSKLDDPTDNKSITFLINNNDLPYGPQNAFLMELNIVGSNGVSLFENIWLNLIRSAPEIAFLPFTNGTFKISSSLPLERIQ